MSHGARAILGLALVLIAGALIGTRALTGLPRPFFDAYTPPQAYRWVSPPASLAHGNQAPASGQTLVPLTNGRSDPASAFTDDGQVTISFNPGTFAAAQGQSAVQVRIMPIAPTPTPPAGLAIDGNAYRIDATYVPSGAPAGPLLLPVLLDLRYPGTKPDAIYRIDGKSWTTIGGTVQPLLLTIDARSDRLGTFAAGHQAAATAAPSSGINLLPFGLGALAIIGVFLLAGVRIRRPRSAGRAAERRRTRRDRSR